MIAGFLAFVATVLIGVVIIHISNKITDRLDEISKTIVDFHYTVQHYTTQYSGLHIIDKPEMTRYTQTLNLDGPIVTVYIRNQDVSKYVIGMPDMLSAEKVAVDIIQNGLWITDTSKIENFYGADDISKISVTDNGNEG